MNDMYGPLMLAWMAGFVVVTGCVWLSVEISARRADRRRNSLRAAQMRRFGREG